MTNDKPAADEAVEVTQAAREAADEHYPPHLWRKEARDDLAKAFARFERDILATLSPDDKLRGALREAADKFDCLAASMREEEADLLAPEIAVAELGRDECRAALGDTA